MYELHVLDKRHATDYIILVYYYPLLEDSDFRKVPWIQLNSGDNVAIKTLCWFSCSPSILRCSATLPQRFTSTWLYRGWIIMMFRQKINIHRQSRRSEAVTAGGEENEPYLTAAADVVTPVVGRTFVTSFSHGVGRTDTLTCVSVTVISHMGTLARCETDRNREQVNCGAQLSTCSKCQCRLSSLLR